jgi:hypothetical protein
VTGCPAVITSKPAPTDAAIVMRLLAIGPDAARRVPSPVSKLPMALAQALHRPLIAATDRRKFDVADIQSILSDTSSRLGQPRRCIVSTLNEIAANHARLAKKLAGESTEVCAQQPQVLGGFEIVSVEEQPNMPLHFIPSVQDSPLAQMIGYAI